MNSQGKKKKKTSEIIPESDFQSRQRSRAGQIPSLSEKTSHVSSMSSSECFFPAVAETLEYPLRLHTSTCDLLHSQICQTEIVDFGTYRCVLESSSEKLIVRDHQTHTPSLEGRGRILAGGSPTQSAESSATITSPDS